MCVVILIYEHNINNIRNALSKLHIGVGLIITGVGNAGWPEYVVWNVACPYALAPWPERDRYQIQWWQGTVQRLGTVVAGTLWRHVIYVSHRSSPVNIFQIIMNLPNYFSF